MQRQLRVEASPPVHSYAYVSLARPADDSEWPIMFQSIDPAADGGARLIELHQDHLILRRRMAGIAMKLRLELRAYQGLAVALLDPEGDDDGVAIVLIHADPALSITLYSAPHIDDVVAEWRRWSSDLGLPMLVTEPDDTLRAAYPMIGRLVVGASLKRRNRRGVLKHRRPAVFRRRGAGRPVTNAAVHRGEREMSARD